MGNESSSPWEDQAPRTAAGASATKIDSRRASPSDPAPPHQPFPHAMRGALAWKVEQELRAEVQRRFDDPRVHQRLVSHLRACRSDSAMEVRSALACAMSVLPPPTAALTAANAERIEMSAAIAIALGCAMTEGALAGPHAVDPAVTLRGTVSPGSPPEDRECDVSMRRPVKGSLWDEEHPSGSVLVLTGTQLSVRCKREWSERARRCSNLAGHSVVQRKYAADAGNRHTLCYDLSAETIEVSESLSHQSGPGTPLVWSIIQGKQAGKGRKAGKKTTLIKIRHAVGQERAATNAWQACRDAAEGARAERGYAEKMRSLASGPAGASHKHLFQLKAQLELEKHTHKHRKRKQKKQMQMQKLGKNMVGLPKHVTWLPQHGRLSLYNAARTHTLIGESDAKLVMNHHANYSAVEKFKSSAEWEARPIAHMSNAVESAMRRKEFDKHAAQSKIVAHPPGKAWLEWHSERRMERQQAESDELVAAEDTLTYAALLVDTPAAHEALAMYIWRVKGDISDANRHFSRAIELRRRTVWRERTGSKTHGIQRFSLEERLLRTHRWINGVGKDAMDNESLRNVLLPRHSEPGVASAGAGAAAEADESPSIEEANEATRDGLCGMRLAYAHYWRGRLNHARAVTIDEDHRSVNQLLDIAESSYTSAIHAAEIAMLARHDQARVQLGEDCNLNEVMKKRKSVLEIKAWLSLSQLLLHRLRDVADMPKKCAATVRLFDDLVSCSKATLREVLYAQRPSHRGSDAMIQEMYVSRFVHKLQKSKRKSQAEAGSETVAEVETKVAAEAETETNAAGTKTPAASPKMSSFAARFQKVVIPSFAKQNQWEPTTLLKAACAHSRSVEIKSVLTVSSLASFNRRARPSSVALRRSLAFRLNVDHPRWALSQKHTEDAKMISSLAFFERVRTVAEGATDWIHAADLVRADINAIDRTLAYAPTGHARHYINSDAVIGSWEKEVLGAMASFPPLSLAANEPITRAEQTACSHHPRSGPRSGENRADVIQMHAMAHSFLSDLITFLVTVSDAGEFEEGHFDKLFVCRTPTAASKEYIRHERDQQMLTERILHRKASLELEPLNAKNWCAFGRLLLAASDMFASIISSFPSPEFCFRRALSIERDSFDANCHLGMILASQARIDTRHTNQTLVHEAMQLLAQANRQMGAVLWKRSLARKAATSPGGLTSPKRERRHRMTSSPIAPASSALSRQMVEAIEVKLALARLLYDVNENRAAAASDAKAICKAVVELCEESVHTHFQVVGWSGVATGGGVLAAARTRAQLLYARCILRCAAAGDTIGDARRMLLCAAANASGIDASHERPPSVSSIVRINGDIWNVGKGFMFRPFDKYGRTVGGRRSSPARGGAASKTAGTLRFEEEEKMSSAITCRLLLGDMIVSHAVKKRNIDRHTIPTNSMAAIDESTFSVTMFGNDNTFGDDDDDDEDEGCVPISSVEAALWLLRSGADDLMRTRESFPFTQFERAQLAHSQLTIALHRTDGAFFRRCVCDITGIPPDARRLRLRLAGVAALNHGHSALAEEELALSLHGPDATFVPGDVIQCCITDCVEGLEQAAQEMSMLNVIAERAIYAARSAANAAHLLSQRVTALGMLAATTYTVTDHVLLHIPQDGSDGEHSLVSCITRLYSGAAGKLAAVPSESTGHTTGVLSDALRWQDVVIFAEDFELPSLVLAVLMSHEDLFIRAVGGQAAFDQLLNLIPRETDTRPSTLTKRPLKPLWSKAMLKVRARRALAGAAGEDSARVVQVHERSPREQSERVDQWKVTVPGELSALFDAPTLLSISAISQRQLRALLGRTACAIVCNQNDVDSTCWQFSEKMKHLEELHVSDEVRETVLATACSGALCLLQVIQRKLTKTVTAASERTHQLQLQFLSSSAAPVAASTPRTHQLQRRSTWGACATACATLIAYIDGPTAEYAQLRLKRETFVTTMRSLVSAKTHLVNVSAAGPRRQTFVGTSYIDGSTGGGDGHTAAAAMSKDEEEHAAVHRDMNHLEHWSGVASTAFLIAGQTFSMITRMVGVEIDQHVAGMARRGVTTFRHGITQSGSLDRERLIEIKKRRGPVPTKTVEISHREIVRDSPRKADWRTHCVFTTKSEAGDDFVHNTTAHRARQANAARATNALARVTAGRYGAGKHRDGVQKAVDGNLHSTKSFKVGGHGSHGRQSIGLEVDANSATSAAGATKWAARMHVGTRHLNPFFSRYVHQERHSIDALTAAQRSKVITEISGYWERTLAFVPLDPAAAATPGSDQDGVIRKDNAQADDDDDDERDGAGSAVNGFDYAAANPIDISAASLTSNPALLKSVGSFAIAKERLHVRRRARELVRGIALRGGNVDALYSEVKRSVCGVETSGGGGTVPEALKSTLPWAWSVDTFVEESDDEFSLAAPMTEDDWRDWDNFLIDLWRGSPSRIEAAFRAATVSCFIAAASAIVVRCADPFIVSVGHALGTSSSHEGRRQPTDAQYNCMMTRMYPMRGACDVSFVDKNGAPILTDARRGVSLERVDVPLHIGKCAAPAFFLLGKTLVEAEKRRKCSNLDSLERLRALAANGGSAGTPSGTAAAAAVNGKAPSYAWWEDEELSDRNRELFALPCRLVAPQPIALPAAFSGGKDGNARDVHWAGDAEVVLRTALQLNSSSGAAHISSTRSEGDGMLRAEAVRAEQLVAQQSNVAGIACHAERHAEAMCLVWLADLYALTPHTASTANSRDADDDDALSASSQLRANERAAVTAALALCPESAFVRERMLRFILTASAEAEAATERKNHSRSYALFCEDWLREALVESGLRAPASSSSSVSVSSNRSARDDDVKRRWNGSGLGSAMRGIFGSNQSRGKHDPLSDAIHALMALRRNTPVRLLSHTVRVDLKVVDAKTINDAWTHECQEAAAPNHPGMSSSERDKQSKALREKMRKMLPSSTIKAFCKVLKKRFKKDVDEVRGSGPAAADGGDTVTHGTGELKIALKYFIPSGRGRELEDHEAVHLRRWTHASGRPEDYSNQVMQSDLDEANGDTVSFEELQLKRTRRGKEFSERLHQSELQRAFDMHQHGGGGYDELDETGSGFLENPTRHDHLTERSKAFHTVDAMASRSFERHRRLVAQGTYALEGGRATSASPSGGAAAMRTALPREWRVVRNIRAPYRIETPALSARHNFEPIRVLSVAEGDETAAVFEERYWLPRAIWTGIHSVVCFGVGAGRLRVDWPHFHASPSDEYSAPFAMPLASGVAFEPPPQRHGPNGGVDVNGNGIADFGDLSVGARIEVQVADPGGGAIETTVESMKTSVGERVRHPKRGSGVVIAVKADDEDVMRTHVRFDASGETHRYNAKSWVKMTRARSANELALRHRSILRKLRAADSEHDLDNSAASGAAAGAQSKSVKSRQLAERWIQRSLTGVILRMHTLESFAERQTHTDSGTTNRLAALPSAADVGPRSRIFDTSARVEYSTKGAGGGGLEAQQQAQELATHFDVLYDNGEFESHVERDRVRSLADLHRDELERGWQTRAGFV